MIFNELKYPWLAATAITGGWSSGVEQSNATATNATTIEGQPWWKEGWSLEGQEKIGSARDELELYGAVAFPGFLTQDAVESAVDEMLTREDNAFTTNTEHTAYLNHDDYDFPPDSIYHHRTKTIVASTAYDELSEDSVLKQLYTDPRLLKFVSSIVLPDEQDEESSKLYLSEDPLGCCSVNVFRPGYFHGLHYDESEFSVTLMLQDAEDPRSGLFQYTEPIRTKILPNETSAEDDPSGLTLGLRETADVFRRHEHDAGASSIPQDRKKFAEPHLHLDEHHFGLQTLDFRPGTLLVLAGSRSLHRVTAVKGNRSRFVAVLTFARRPGFCNTPEVQEMFWGRTGNATSNNCRTEEQLQECEAR